MEPADTIIEKLGGVSAVARITGRHRTRVSNWKRAQEAGGTGGMIPVGVIRKLISYASSQQISLEYADFFPAPAPSSMAGAAPSASSSPDGTAADARGAASAATLSQTDEVL